MITHATVRATVMKILVSEGCESQTIDDVAHAVMDHLKYQLTETGLIITSGGPHLLDANDKTIWRADAVGGVAAHVDPNQARATEMINRRFGRRP